MITINHKTYSQYEIEQVFNLAKELLAANEELNSKIIAFDAKLKNEEKKVKDLQYKLWLLQMETLNNYKA
jgi:hypothetical protein